MNTKITICILLIAMVIQSQAEVPEDTITVTASRLELPITATLNDLIVIDTQEIETSSALSLFELLQSKSGIDWVRKGGPGQEISMFVRGSGTNQLLVLMDGIEIGSATLGYKALSDINLSQVERIEIVKGPRAAIWGSKAIGGVMQIFSREERAVRLAVGLGSFNERRVNVATGFELKALSGSISVDSFSSDGIDARLDGDADKDGIERDNLNLMTKYRPSSEQEIILRYTASEGVTEYDSAFGDDELLVDNNVLSVNYLVNQANNTYQIQFGRQSDSSITRDDGLALFKFETISESIKYLFDTKQSESWKIGTSLEYLNEDVGNSSTTYNDDQRTTVSG
ncbi:MAG: TonB-dependent receptor plug domain-containing protein, partial [Enterobacterales bacterium]|nr:TonB-dependent receptor plug domain-containing protein [Enterobacterales bacterium]